jgi:hypothetical protein
MDNAGTDVLLYNALFIHGIQHPMPLQPDYAPKLVCVLKQLCKTYETLTQGLILPKVVLHDKHHMKLYFMTSARHLVWLALRRSHQRDHYHWHADQESTMSNSTSA